MFSGERGGGEGDRFRSEAEYRGRQIDSLYSNVQSVRVREEPKPSDELMLRSINFHGQQLGSFMKEASRTLDLKNVDYQLYHQRSKELKLEDRGKRLLLHRFIAQKSDVIFQPGKGLRTNRRTLDNAHTDDHAALLPPLEIFANIGQDDRSKRFFDIMETGDTLFCRIQQKKSTGLVLNVICLDPLTGKSRYIEDIRVRGFCPSAEMVPAYDPRDPSRTYETGDVVRVAILEIKSSAESFLAGMLTESLPPDLQNIVKLGLVADSDLPSILRSSRQALEGGYLYEEFVEKGVGFINPSNVMHLCSELGLEPTTTSLMPDLEGNYPAKHYATEMRKAQNSKWAFKHVHLGIKHFKENNKIEAFQCLNQALNIDPQNVEGLVARGALYANNNGLERAIEDFEAALKINSLHQNAKKYLCETLIAVGRNHEDDKNFIQALETYERIVRLDPLHKEAKDSMFYLKGRPLDVPVEAGVSNIPGLDSDKALISKDKLKFMLEDERGSSRKEKRRKESVSSLEDSEEERQKSKKRRKERRSRSSSLSPLSRRSGPQNSRAISPFASKLNPEEGMNRPAEFGGLKKDDLYSNPCPDLARMPVSGLDRRSPGLDGSSGISIQTLNPVMPIQSLSMSQPPPVYGVPPGYPGYPPLVHPHRYPPHRTQADEDYDDKVKWFLQQTNNVPPRHDYGSRMDRHRDPRDRHDHRSRGADDRRRDDRSRGRSDSRERPRRDSLGRGDSRARADSRGDSRVRADSHVRAESRGEYRIRGDSRGRGRSRSGGRSRSREERARDPYSSSRDRNNSVSGVKREDTVIDLEEDVKVEKIVESGEKKKSKKSKSEKYKKSLSPLLDILKDEELKKKLKMHLRGESKAEEEKKKKKKKQVKSESRSPKAEPEKPKKSKKEKVKGKSKNGAAGSDTIEVLSSEEDQKKKKSKKKTKEDKQEEFKTEDKSSRKRNSPPRWNDVKNSSQRSDSPRKGHDRRRDSSPRKQEYSSRKRDNSPKRRDDSPRRRDDSPRRRDDSPRRRDNSPRRRDSSPRRKDVSPVYRDSSRKKESSSRRRDYSPSPKRKSSPTPPPKKAKSPPNPRKNVSSKNVFDEDPKPSPNKGSVFGRLELPKLPKSGGLWIPTGEDSLRETINKAVSKMEENRKKYAKSSVNPPKFDPHKKISMSADAPPPAVDYDVTYDPKIGMYIRVPKIQVKEKTPPRTPPKTKAQKVASKKSKMDLENEKKEDPDIQVLRPKPPVQEERVVRSLASPPRSNHKDYHSSDRRRSRSRSHGRRSRSRGRRSQSRGHESRSYDKPNGDRRPGDKRYDDDGRRTEGKKDSKGTSRYDYDSQITDMREETQRLKKEREAIEREKAELMALTRGEGNREELSGLENVMDTVLDAVGSKTKKPVSAAEPVNIKQFLEKKKAEKGSSSFSLKKEK